MAQTIDIVVPDLGDFENVEIIEVLVGSGDKVSPEDGLITLETDKASFDVPAPESGVIESLSVGVGDSVSTGDVIGSMSVEISDTVVITPAMAATPSGETTGFLASPVVVSCSTTLSATPTRYRSLVKRSYSQSSR